MSVFCFFIISGSLINVILIVGVLELNVYVYLVIINYSDECFSEKFCYDKIL